MYSRLPTLVPRTTNRSMCESGTRNPDKRGYSYRPCTSTRVGERESSGKRSDGRPNSKPVRYQCTIRARFPAVDLAIIIFKRIYQHNNDACPGKTRFFSFAVRYRVDLVRDPNRNHAYVCRRTIVYSTGFERPPRARQRFTLILLSGAS